MVHRDRVVTAAEMAEIDARAQSVFGIPAVVLMENAGQAAWRTLRRHAAPGEGAIPEIVFIAGTGNNGGDALVMVRQCLVERVAAVTVVTLRRELRGSVAAQWDILERLGLLRVVWDDDPDACRVACGRADWIVDGITGTGLRSPLRNELRPLLDAVNGAEASVCAIDVPSGLRDGAATGDPIVAADLTIVTGYLKRALFAPRFRHLAGTIECVDPGFPPSLVEDAAIVTGAVRMMPEVTVSPSPPRRDAHKGNRGRVLVVGGADDTAGAPVLAAAAAQAMGAGMVRLVAPAASQAAMLARDPAVMTGGPDADAAALCRWADAVVIGPGWLDLDDGALTRWFREAEAAGTAVVMDAAALRVLSRGADAWRSVLGGTVPTVLTPHVGEWDALAEACGIDRGTDIWEALTAFPSRPGLWILVKSSVSLLRTDSGAVEIVDGRVPALATAGSGDVLAGAIGAALARARAGAAAEIASALRWAVSRHLAAGRRLAATGGSATALVDALQRDDRGGAGRA